MFAATSMLVLALAATEYVPALELTVTDTDGSIRVVRVVRGGRSDRAGVRPGQYIVRVGRTRVESVDELILVLQDRPGSFDLEVSDDEPLRGRMWLGLAASGHGWTGQEDTQSCWLGVQLALELTEGLRGIAGIGYVALGYEPFVGRDAFTPLFGLHYETGAIFDDFTTFGRILIGPNITYTDVIRPGFWTQEPLTVLAQAGLRVWWVDLALSGGWGPARAQNIGINITVWFPLGSLFE